MNNIFKLILVTSPLAGILLYLLLIQTEKTDIRYENNQSNFQQEWSDFDKEFQAVLKVDIPQEDIKKDEQDRVQEVSPKAKALEERMKRLDKQNNEKQLDEMSKKSNTLLENIETTINQGL
jgi:hypothetical protein